MIPDREDFGLAMMIDSTTGQSRPLERRFANDRRLVLTREGEGGQRRSVFRDRPLQPGRDVICAGMYRACSTWQYEVVSHLVEHHLQGERLGYVTGENYRTMARPIPRGPEQTRAMSWRVLKSHEGDRSFARGLTSGRALAVYSFRDLREVVFSLMRKRAISFQELLRQGMIHQLLANDRFWRAQPRVLLQRYEDLIDEPVTGVLQLARHLGLGVTRREATEIADEYSIASNQARVEFLRQRLHDAGIDLTDPANLQICDPTTLLHWNHLGPGRASSWRRSASPNQQALLDRVFGAWLEKHGYESKQGDLTTACASRAVAFLASYARDLAIGRAVFVLRAVAGLCPRTARLIRQLSGIQNPDRGELIVWNGGEGQPLSAPPACRVAMDCEDTPAAAVVRTRRPGHLA
jgi:hypothetical protein